MSVPSPPLAWLAAFCALLPAFALAVAATLRGSIAQRFAGSQLAVSLAAILLAVLTYVIGQPSSIDLALTVALLGLPGSLLVAVFAERWL